MENDKENKKKHENIVEDFEKVPDLEAKEEETIMEEIELQFFWYMFPFMITYFGSFLIPLISFMLYFLLAFMPNVLTVTQFHLIFLDLSSLLSLIFMPLVLIGCYVMHLLFIGIITRFWWRLSEKIVPTKNGIIPRNIPSKTLNFYHIRSFLIKYPKYVFTKGAFPWLANWMYNYVGSNKIGKNTTIEEQVCGDKYINVGENCYVGVNSVLTSHLVEGIFGNVIYFELLLGDNVTLAGLNNYASGCELRTDSWLLPWASGGKHYVVKGKKKYYFGLPPRRLTKTKLKKYAGLTPEDVERGNEMLEKRRNKDNKEEKINE